MANVCVSCPAPRRASRRSYRRAPARRYRRAAPRRRSYRRRAAPRYPNGRATSRRPAATLTQFELGQVNPFDKRVMGVKIPDSNTQPSDTFVAEDRVAITGAATDLAICRAFQPNMRYMVAASTNSSSTAWTWGTYAAASTESAYSTDAAANFIGLRPVSHGVRLSSALSPTLATGFVHIGIYPSSQHNSANWELPLNISQMTNLPFYRRFTLASLTQRSVTVVNKFIDITAQRYIDTDSDLVSAIGVNELHFETGWCSIIIATEGAPVLSSNLSIENICHFEALPKFSSTLTLGSTPAANFNVREMEDVSRLSAKSSGIILEGEENEAIGHAVRAIGREALRAAGNYATAYITGAPSPWIGGIPGVNDSNRLMN